MKKLATLFFALGFVLALAVPAQARLFIAVNPGFGAYYPGYYYGYPGYYPGYVYSYPGYYYPPYYAPPPVAYAPPPSVTYVVPPATPMAGAPLAANQTSPTFTDALGRTCRRFQTTSGVGPTSGTACLMPDGSWRTVQ